MKRIGTLLLLCCIGLGMQAQGYRAPGYKGSVSLADMGYAFIGVETSHGYMLSENHYLGAGAGAYIFPDGKDYPKFGIAFIDYQAYLLDKKSTPFLGCKVGAFHVFKRTDRDGGAFVEDAVMAEPGVGWTWGLNSGQGLSVSLGIPVLFPVGNNYGHKKVYTAPHILFTFEF